MKLECKAALLCSAGQGLAELQHNGGLADVGC